MKIISMWTWITSLTCFLMIRDSEWHEMQELKGFRPKLRRLTHYRCWWSDDYCCTQLLQCKICSNVCNANSYTKGIWITGQACWVGTPQDCIKKPATDDIDCRHQAKAITITKTFTQFGGAALSVLTGFSDLYSNPAGCGVYTCSAFTLQSGVNMDSCITLTPAGVMTLNANTCTDFGTSTYKVSCGGDPFYMLNSGLITITLIQDYCPSIVNTIANHASLVQQVNYQVDGNTPTFPVNPFSAGDPTCPVLSITIFATDKTSNVPNTVTSVSGTTTNFQATLPYVEANYDFSIRVITKSVQVHWANIAGNDVFRLRVYCSVVFTQNSFTGGNTDVQWIRKNNLEFFVLPGFTGCPITLYQSSESNVTVTSPALFVQDPVLNSVDMVVRPKDDSLDKSYYFYVKISMIGSRVGWSTFMTLHVECSPDGLTVTKNPVFINQLTKYVGDNNRRIYTILPPTTSLPYCLTSKNELFNIKQDNVILATAMVLETSCKSLQPCWELDSHLLSRPQKITFQIRTTVDGGTVIESPLATIYVINNCPFFSFNHVTDRLKVGELREYVYWNNLDATRNQQNTDFVSRSWLIANYTIGNFTTEEMAFDISPRIRTNASQYCPVIAYGIEKVVEAKSGKTIDKHQIQQELVMLDNGTISFGKVNNRRSWFIWLKVSNEVRWMTNPLPAIWLNTTRPEVFINHPPFFDIEPPLKGAITINVSQMRRLNQTRYVIQLPAVLDANENDTWAIKIRIPVPFISFDYTTKELYFNEAVFSDYNLGFHYMTMLLYDRIGDYNDYDLILNLILDDPVQLPPPVAPPRIQDFPRSHSQNQNVTAFIKSISIFGEMVVQFNASMNTNFNHSLVNRTLVDMYIEPWGRSPEHNMSLVNFTWQLINVSSSLKNVSSYPKNVSSYPKNVSSFYHFYKLNWSHPEEISPLREQDTIVFYLRNDSEAFYSHQVKNHLHESSWLMRSKVRKQLEDQQKTRIVMSTANQAAESSTWLLVLAFLFNLFAVGKGTKYYMWYLRGVQINCHLPMLSTVVPPNVSSFNENLISFVQFDILDPEWTTELLFNFDYPVQRQLAINILDQMENIGYDTHSSILILGSLWIFMMLVIFLLVVVYFLKLVRFLSKGRYKFKFLKSLGDRLLYKDLMQLTVDGYIVWSIAAYFNIKVPVYTNGGDVMSNYSAYLSIFICLGLVPFALLILIFYPIKMIKRKGIYYKFAFFFEDIKTKTRFQMCYFVFWIGRRAIFMYLCFFFSKTPSMQIFLMIYVNLLFHLFAGTYPFTDKYLNRHGLFEEMINQILLLHMMLFTDLVPDQKDKVLFGWSLVGISSAHLLYQIILQVVYLSLYLFLFGQKYYKVLMQKYDRYMGYDNESYLSLIKRFGSLDLSQSPPVIKTNKKLNKRKSPRKSPRKSSRKNQNPIEPVSFRNPEFEAQKLEPNPIPITNQIIPFVKSRNRFIELDDTAFVPKKDRLNQKPDPKMIFVQEKNKKTGNKNKPSEPQTVIKPKSNQNIQFSPQTTTKLSGPQNLIQSKRRRIELDDTAIVQKKKFQTPKFGAIQNESRRSLSQPPVKKPEPKKPLEKNTHGSRKKSEGSKKPEKFVKKTKAASSSSPAKISKSSVPSDPISVLNPLLLGLDDLERMRQKILRKPMEKMQFTAQNEEYRHQTNKDGSVLMVSNKFKSKNFKK